MAKSNFSLLEELVEAKSRIEKYVLLGSLPDFATYRYYTGQIKGFQEAIDICKELYKKGKYD